MMKKMITVFALLLLLCCASCSGEEVDELTYAVFPYLPDVGYYQERIEKRWAELEPDIRLVRAEWNCYSDGAPEGIDVVIYDAVGRDALIEAGCIQPIPPDAVQHAEDIFPFALDGLTVDGGLYGIPVFLCGNFLIYDQNCGIPAKAEHLTDLGDEAGLLVINSRDPMNLPQYMYEVLADMMGEANPSPDCATEDALALIDLLAIDEYESDDYIQVAMAYDSGVGQGYIGFSESLRFLTKRIDDTGIKSISFSSRENVPRVYADAAAVTGGVTGQRFEKCLKLINVMAEADILTSLTVQDGVPQYLLLARISPYAPLADRFPLYAQLEMLAGNPKNRVILGP